LKDKQNQFIKHDATAFIGSDGLVGNKIVVIRPGTSPQVLQDTDTLGAFSPADTQDLINIARDVGENTRSLTHDLQALTKKIADGQGIVGELMQDGPLAHDIRAVVDGFKSTSSQTARASQDLAAVMYKLNNGDGLMNALASDTTLPIVFDETLRNVKEVSRNSAEMSKTIGRLVARMNNGNNAIGLLLADTVFANQLKSASFKLDENMEALRHNIFLRGYFRKKEKQAKKNKEATQGEAALAPAVEKESSGQ
jgi:phospholipid/cholesterol/gamma-HCH transport system substrate-binding protein